MTHAFFSKLFSPAARASFILSSRPRASARVEGPAVRPHDRNLCRRL